MMLKSKDENLRVFLKLISFLKKIRHEEDKKKLDFFFVNHLADFIPYKQCVVWEVDGSVSLNAASGHVDINKRSPYAKFLKKVILKPIDKNSLDTIDGVNSFFEGEASVRIEPYTISSYSSFDPTAIKRWVSPHSICIFVKKEGELKFGIWLERNSPFNEMELAIIEEASDAYADKRTDILYKRPRFLKKISSRKSSKKWVLLFLLLLALFPTRNSISVEVEVTSEELLSVSAPYNGQIDTVSVSPNQVVSKGDLLFSMDSVTLRNDYTVAVQELQTAKQKLRKTEREAFIDNSKKNELKIIEQQIRLQEIEVKYTLQRLGLSEVRAQKDGLVLFGNENDMVGKPVQVGQQAMILANPDKVKLLLSIPVKGFIEIDQDVPIKFFLNVEPLVSHDAMLESISYKPEENANGVFGYSGKAAILNPEGIKRIGLTGSAKLYGSRTIFILSVLRRPFISLRNFLKL